MAPSSESVVIEVIGCSVGSDVAPSSESVDIEVAGCSVSSGVAPSSESHVTKVVN